MKTLFVTLEEHYQKHIAKIGLEVINCKVCAAVIDALALLVDLVQEDLEE